MAHQQIASKWVAVRGLKLHNSVRYHLLQAREWYEFGLQGTTLSPLGRGVKYKNILPCLTETLISPVIITIRRLLVPPELLNQPHCNCCLAQLLPLPCPSLPLTYGSVIAAHVSFHSSLLIKSICKETGSDSPRSTAAPAAYLPT